MTRRVGDAGQRNVRVLCVRHIRQVYNIFVRIGADSPAGDRGIAACSGTTGACPSYRGYRIREPKHNCIITLATFDAASIGRKVDVEITGAAVTLS